MKEDEVMMRVSRKNDKMSRPQKKKCGYCGCYVIRAKRICPECGRLLMRGLSENTWKELVKEEMCIEREAMGCFSGNEEMFQKVKEELEQCDMVL